jgi:hypothetical protein
LRSTRTLLAHDSTPIDVKCRSNRCFQCSRTAVRHGHDR